MENIWEYCFEKLGYSQVEDCRCLLTEIIDNSKENRMKTCQYFFERFGTSKFLLMNQSVLSLYNAAKTNGVIIDSGYSNTYVVPIYEGYALHSQVGKLKISGMDIENYLQKSLIEKDRKFTSRKFRNTLNELMKNNCYYALDYEFETKKASKRFLFIFLKKTIIFVLQENRTRVSLYQMEKI